jgi:DNA-binding transcriptional ArsR family regulator
MTLSGETVVAADLTLVRSAVRRRILALLPIEPPTRLHLREIQRRAGTSPGTASRELARLEAAGLVERAAEGHQVYFSSATSPLATMLRSVLLAMSEPQAAPAPPRKGAAEPPPADRAEGAARPVQADPVGLSVAGRLAEALRGLYGDRLRGAYLYGSRAAGLARPDSDVDVLVVLDRIERYGDELERTSGACVGLTLELGLVVSRVFVSEERWLSREELHAIRETAVAV